MIDGRRVCGAGGGEFLHVILKKGIIQREKFMIGLNQYFKIVW